MLNALDLIDAAIADLEGALNLQPGGSLPTTTTTQKPDGTTPATDTTTTKSNTNTKTNNTKTNNNKTNNNNDNSNTNNDDAKKTNTKKKQKAKETSTLKKGCERCQSNPTRNLQTRIQSGTNHKGMDTSQCG